MSHKYFGDKAFYRRVLGVAVPIILQNGISNFVSLLDNIMVGRVGTLQMSGVSIVNQLMFVFNLCVFGAMSGAGIFTAQFHGSGDENGVRHTFRFKFLVGLALGAGGIVLFCFAGTPLINLYLQGDGDSHDIAMTLAYGKSYLGVLLLGLLPFALANAYASTLRETGQTVVPMAAGIAAVLVNLGLNYVLIFGHLGAPAMGVRGAAAATVISRYVELAIVAGWTHLHPERCPFIQGAYRTLEVPGPLLKAIFRKGMPLLVNEFLWSSGMAVMNQCYSLRGLDVVAALNISSTLYNLASVVYLAMGNSVGILMGQMLGAGIAEQEVRAENRRMLALSVLSCLVFAAVMAAVSPLFPRIYNTTDAVRTLAARLICICAVMMPFNAYTNAAYFTLRSGGQTLVTFLFDSCFVWTCCVPVAMALSRLTNLPIVPLYAACQALDMLKCVIGAGMIHRGAWIRNLTEPGSPAQS